MIHVLKRIQNLVARLSKRTLLLLSMISFGVLSFSVVAIYLFERNTNDNFNSVWDAVWYSIVTLTTVGYGDKYPITLGGQITAIIVMLAGIGLLAALLGALVTMITNLLAKRRKGMQDIKDTDHILICGWNAAEGPNVVRELIADNPQSQVVLIANLDEHPLLDVSQLSFVKGSATNEEVLKKAGGTRAKVALVFAEDGLDPESDAKTVMVTMNLKAINPKIYVCAELVDDAHVDYLKRAGADAIVDPTRIGSNIMVQSLQDPGISDVIAELISNRKGNTFYKMAVPDNLVGKTFAEAVSELSQAILVGYERDGVSHVNPDRSSQLKSGDYLFLIAAERI